MQKFTGPLFASTLVVASIVVSSCGGSASSGGNSAEIQREYGDFTTRTAGAVAPPMIMSTAGLTVTGIFGTAFSLARVNFPAPTLLNADEVVAQTQIAYDGGNRPFIFSLRTGRSYLPTLGLPSSGVLSSPAISPLGDRFYTVEQDAASGFNQVFVTNIDGTGRTRLTSDASYKYNVDVSADGARLAFSRWTGANYELATMAASGGTITNIPPSNGASRYNPRWSPNGTLISFHDSDNRVYVVTPTGTGLQQQTIGIEGMTGADWLPNGDLVVTSFSGATSYLSRKVVGGNWFRIFSTPDVIFQPSPSPDGSQVAFARSPGGGANLWTIPLAGGSASVRTNSNDVYHVNWGPYIRQKTLIGSGGALSSGAGFLVAQAGKDLSGYVVFDSVTRESVTVTPGPASGSQNTMVCILSGDSLNQIRFSNNLFGPVTPVLTSGATANGAVIAFDSATGDVATVIPYTGATATLRSVGDSIVASGNFLGVWNAEGKNLAEGGADKVTIDRRSGVPAVR